MKVCFIYREKRVTGFSIEEVFRNVRRELPSSVIQLEYIVDATKSKWWNMKQVRKVEADIYHITGDCNYMAIMLPKDKSVLTIHDIGHLELTLKGVKRLVYKLLWWTLPLAKVKLVSTVSDFTNKKVLEFFKQLKPNMVRTVYNPANKSCRFSKKNSLNKKPQILQVGGGSNKNIDTLIAASKDLDVKLVLVRLPNENLKNSLEELDIDFQWHSNLSEEELIEVYSHVDVVYFASTYEGFGLPIIEAQSIGRPVITSSVCSMPEVNGGGGYIVNPTSVDEVRDAIERLLQWENWQAEVTRGLENVKRFEPSKIAKEYLELYKEIEQSK